MFVVRTFDDLLNNRCFFGWENNDKKMISCGVDNPVMLVLRPDYPAFDKFIFKAVKSIKRIAQIFNI